MGTSIVGSSLLFLFFLYVTCWVFSSWPPWRWSGRQRGTAASQLSSFVVCRLGGSPNHVQPPPRPLPRGPRMTLIQRDGVLLLMPTVPPRLSWRSSWCIRRRRLSSSRRRSLVGNTALKSLRVGQWRLSLWLGCTWRSAGGEGGCGDFALPWKWVVFNERDQNVKPKPARLVRRIDLGQIPESVRRKIDGSPNPNGSRDPVRSTTSYFIPNVSKSRRVRHL
jgi:hypothetical protein